MGVSERDATGGASVDDLFANRCTRCGAATFGPSTCRLCLEALRELRALAEDGGTPVSRPVRV
jgi:hypothetical protein